MSVEAVADGVYQVGVGYVNSFIVDGDEGVTLVDTLLPRKEGVVAEALGGIGRSFDDIRAILLTHSHADHSGSAAAIKAGSGAAVWASERDAPAIRGEVKPPSPITPLYVKPLALGMSLLPAPPPTEIDGFVSSGDLLPGDLRAVDTPGHTPGHTSYLLDRGGGVLFAGDAAKATRRGEVARGYFNRSTPTLDRSLRHLAELDFDVAVFGHSRALRSQAASVFRRFAEAL